MGSNNLRDDFDRLEALCEHLGLEVQGLSDEDVDGVNYLVLNCSFGNEPLTFIGSIDEDWRHILVRYSFDVVENLAIDLRNKDGSQETLRDFEEDEYIKSARSELSSIDIDWSDVKYGLVERLVSESCYFRINDSENVPLRSFQVEKKIFIDKFDITDLDDAISAVIGRGAMGRLWLAECLGRTDEIFSSNHSELEPDSAEDNDLGYIG